MLMTRRRVLLGTALLSLAVPALAQARFDLGAIWRVEERSRTGYWTEKVSGQIIRDIIGFRSESDEQIVLHRRGLKGQYFGRLLPDLRSIRSTASWDDAETYWAAIMEK